jgi:hypothetical protein
VFFSDKQLIDAGLREKCSKANRRLFAFSPVLLAQTFNPLDFARRRKIARILALKGMRCGPFTAILAGRDDSKLSFSLN